MNEDYDVLLYITYNTVIKGVGISYEPIDFIEFEKIVFLEPTQSNITIEHNTVKKPYFQLLTTA